MNESNNGSSWLHKKVKQAFPNFWFGNGFLVTKWRPIKHYYLYGICLYVSTYLSLNCLSFCNLCLGILAFESVKSFLKTFRLGYAMNIFQFLVKTSPAEMFSGFGQVETTGTLKNLGKLHQTRGDDWFFTKFRQIALS